MRAGLLRSGPSLLCGMLTVGCGVSVVNEPAGASCRAVEWDDATEDENTALKDIGLTTICFSNADVSRYDRRIEVSLKFCSLERIEVEPWNSSVGDTAIKKAGNFFQLDIPRDPKPWRTIWAESEQRVILKISRKSKGKSGENAESGDSTESEVLLYIRPGAHPVVTNVKSSEEH